MDKSVNNWSSIWFDAWFFHNYFRHFKKCWNLKRCVLGKRLESYLGFYKQKLCRRRRWKWGKTWAYTTDWFWPTCSFFATQERLPSGEVWMNSLWLARKRLIFILSKPIKTFPLYFMLGTDPTRHSGHTEDCPCVPTGQLTVRELGDWRRNNWFIRVSKRQETDRLKQLLFCQSPWELNYNKLWGREIARHETSLFVIDVPTRPIMFLTVHSLLHRPFRASSWLLGIKILPYSIA